MQVPLLDLKAQYATIKEEIDGVVKKVIESQYFILSDEVKSLEEEVATYSDAGFASGVASGTDAIILSLKALGVGEGDFVITTPFTFFATAESVSILGATPIFVDIDPETYNIDPEKIEECLKTGRASKVKDRVKAIIPVHLYGQCADMDKIMDIAGRYNLKVVEDSAQAIGAVYKGKKAGSFGDSAALSFFPSKNLGGFGDGGMVVSNNEALIKRIKSLRVHGSVRQYVHGEIGYNSRLDSLQAAILRVKLKSLDKWLQGRRNIAERYNKELSEHGIKVPTTLEGNVHTYHQYTVRVDERDKMAAYLQEKGISARVYYPVPLHCQDCYKDLGYSKGSIPVSEEMSEKVLSLPVYPELSDEAVSYVIDTIKGF